MVHIRSKLVAGIQFLDTFQSAELFNIVIFGKTGKISHALPQGGGEVPVFVNITLEIRHGHDVKAAEHGFHVAVRRLFQVQANG